MGVSVAAVYSEAYAQTDCKRRNQNDGNAYRNSDFKFFSHYFIFPLIPNLAGKRARARRARLPLSYLNFLLIIYINMAIKKITRRHILRQNNMCAEGKSAHTVSTEAFRRKKQYECFKIRGILCAMFLSAQINAAGFIRRKAEKFFIFFARSAKRVCRAERAQIFLKRRRHIAVPAPPFRD